MNALSIAAGSLIALAAQSAPTGPALPATESWALERIDLEVTVDPEAKRLLVKGHLTVRLEDERSDGPSLALNSRTKALRYTRATARGVDAKIIPYEDHAEIAHFGLPTTFRRGARLTVDFELQSASESSQIRIRETGFFASWVEQWYPVPATLKHGPASPAAPGTTTFRMPRGWRSVSNGSLVASESAGGITTERWVAEDAVARSFVVAPFVDRKAVQTQGRLVAFHLLKPRDSAEAQATALGRALDAMERRFGPYPYASYHVVEVPEDASFAASSEQGFIMVRSSVLDQVSASLPLFAHEAAHGWWGNRVRGKGPGSKMVTEALAQFGAVLAIEEIEGKAAMDEFLRFSRAGYNPLQCALGYFHIWREGGDKPLAQLESARWDHNLSDSKGMWFYHMLRGRMGDQALFDSLRGLLVDLGGQELTLSQLRERLLKREPSLSSFLDQWLDRPGAPVPRVEWWSIDRGQGVEIDVEQLQDGDPYQVPLDVQLSLAGGQEVRETLQLSGRRQAFRVATPARALSLALDPENRLLMWRPEFGPRPKAVERAAVR